MGVVVVGVMIPSRREGLPRINLSAQQVEAGGIIYAARENTLMAGCDLRVFGDNLGWSHFDVTFRDDSFVKPRAMALRGWGRTCKTGVIALTKFDF